LSKCWQRGKQIYPSDMTAACFRTIPAFYRTRRTRNFNSRSAAQVWCRRVPITHCSTPEQDSLSRGTTASQPCLWRRGGVRTGVQDLFKISHVKKHSIRVIHFCNKVTSHSLGSKHQHQLLTPMTTSKVTRPPGTDADRSRPLRSCAFETG